MEIYSKCLVNWSSERGGTDLSLHEILATALIPTTASMFKVFPKIAPMLSITTLYPIIPIIKLHVGEALVFTLRGASP